MLAADVKTVFLVEDNADHADIVEGMLEEALPAAHVEWVDHGTRAFERLEHLARSDSAVLPDLVLLDLKLPGYGGFEVLRRCRDHAQLKGLKIVMLTSSDAPEDRIAAAAAGADDYLIKSSPISGLGDRLLHAVEAL